VSLEPALAGADAPLQRPCRVREVQGERGDSGFDRHAVQHGVARQHRQRHAQRVAANIAQEYPGADRVPRQEGERAGGDRGASGDQERVRAPCPEAGISHATDQGMGGRDAVHAIHEVEGVHDPGDPEGTYRNENRQPARCRLHWADKQAGGHDARRALQREPLANRQAVQIVSEPDGGEKCDRDTERRRRHTVHQCGGHDKSGGNRDAAAPRCWNGVRRPQAGGVHHGRPPQQRDRHRLGDHYNGAG
jgi:hypothetical protein